MTNLVTGGAGFFGTHLVKFLLDKGEDVRIVDIVKPNMPWDNEVEFIKGSINDKDIMKKACKGVDNVYHTVALVPLSKAGKGFTETNVLGTRSVIESAVAAGANKFVHLSSSAIFDLSVKMPITETSPISPIGVYGQAKYEAELEVNKFVNEIDTTLIRPRTILGTRRAGIYQILYNWIRNGKKIYIIGSGNNLFQLISARDLASSCWLSTKTKKAAGEAFNIGTDEYSTLKQDLVDLCDYAETGSKVFPIPAGPTKLTLNILDKLHLSPLAPWHYLSVDKAFYFDTSKAKNLLGWKPKDSNLDMYKESYDWYLKNYKELEKHKGTTHRVSPKQGILELLKRFS